MLEKGHVQIGRDNVRLTKNTCQLSLAGRWDNALGCFVNSNQKYKPRNGTVFIAPMRVKKLPVHVRRDEFADVTSLGGRLSDVYTYRLG